MRGRRTAHRKGRGKEEEDVDPETAHETVADYLDCDRGYTVARFAAAPSPMSKSGPLEALAFESTNPP